MPTLLKQAPKTAIKVKLWMKIKTSYAPTNTDMSFPSSGNVSVEASQESVQIDNHITAWKVSKYRVDSDPYSPVFGPEVTPYLDTFHEVY